MLSIEGLLNPHRDPAQGLQLEFLQLLHRRTDSWAAFARKLESGEWENIGYQEVGRLPKHVPKKDKLLVNGSVSVNGFFRAGTRQERDLKCLNAAAVDLDSRDLHPRETASRAVDLLQERLLPSPSIVHFSGGGAWLLWIIRSGEDSERPSDAYERQRRILKRINSAIAEMIDRAAPELKADRAAVDLARTIRIPGSFNTRSARVVEYGVQRDDDGKVLNYQLEELAERFEVRDEPRSRRGSGYTRAMRAQNKPAPIARNNLRRVVGARILEMKMLADARGGFQEGTREHAAFVYAALLRTLGHPPENITQEVDSFARLGCTPPLAKHEVKAAVKSAAKKEHKLSNRWIAQRLNVTMEEADALRLTHIRPDFVPRKPKPKGRESARKARRAAVGELLRGSKYRPSLRELARRLNELGFECSPPTVKRDLEALQIAELATESAGVSVSNSGSDNIVTVYTDAIENGVPGISLIQDKVKHSPLNTVQ